MDKNIAFNLHSEDANPKNRKGVKIHFDCYCEKRSDEAIQNKSNGLPRSRWPLAMTLAFTLAEVLITLTIIGVIAALTIPNLYTKYQKHITITAFKKNYAILNTALQDAIAEYDSPDTWAGLNNNPLPTNESLHIRAAANYFKPYLKIQKDCDTQIANCWKVSPKDMLKTSTNSYYFNAGDLGSSIAYKLADGTNILFRFATNQNNYLNITVDINGDKGPNQLGLDVFIFGLNLRNNSITYGKLEGADYWGNLSRYNISSAERGCPGAKNWASGSGCAKLIIMDGFQIKDNYPWK